MVIMLIKCPECNLQLSDKAAFCPHCGYVKSERKLYAPRRNSNKRRRLPNGFGQITKLNRNNLRRPYRAMITVRKTDDGKMVQRLLKPQAYFETYNEAYEALVEYNRNPYDLDDAITMTELYDRWSKEYFKSISETSIRTVSSAWTYCSSIYNMRVMDVRARHIKGCMDDGYRIEYRGKRKGEKIYASSSTKTRIKSLFNLILDYAVEYELVDRNYARTFDISSDVLKDMEENKSRHMPLTTDELNVLWRNVGNVKFVDWILIQSYMGWRPQEMGLLKLEDVDLTNWTMTGGIKTEAGKSRIVPVHTRIKSLVKNNYEFAKSIGSEYLFNDKGQSGAATWFITYDKYSYRFQKVMSQLQLNSAHRPHDPRMAFVTRLKRIGTDEYAIKALVGHKVNDITESTYTLRDIEWLREDIEKLE